MASVSRLKDRARDFERKEDWRKAIDAYLQVINKTEAGDSDAELSLYNRVGDLYLRIGDNSSAVDYYEKAAERYGQAGLYNNAIALCNKALRYEPGRVALYRQLGELSAEQGFVTDARRWYLEYAERLHRAGRSDEAFQALDEFAALTDDPEVREMLASQLEGRGENEAAVTQLRLAYTLRVAAGEADRTEELKERILGLDPELDPDELAMEVQPPAAGDEDAGEPLPGLYVESTAAGAGIVDEEEGGAGVDERPGPGEEYTTAQTGGSAEAAPADAQERQAAEAQPPGTAPDELTGGTDQASGELDADVDAESVPGLVSTDIGAEAEQDVPTTPDEQDVEGLASLETGYGADVDEDTTDVEPLPGFEGFEEFGGADAEDVETTEEAEELPGFEEAAADEEERGAEGEALADIELEDAGALEGEVEAEPLPGFEEAEPAEAFAPEPELPDFEPDEADQPEAVGAPGAEAEEAIEAPEPEPEEVIEAPEPEPEVSEPEPEVLEPEPEPQPEYVQAVEAAAARYHAGEREQALDELERIHTRLADEGRLEEAYRTAEAMIALDPDWIRAHQHRVEYAFRLDERMLLVDAYLDFGNSLKREGQDSRAQSIFQRVLEIEPENAAAKAALARPEEAAQEDQFVDLGSMLRDESEETTRFVVAETHESGDEEKDFQEMLSQFREKVAEHVSQEDSESHYDLGLAFKEMGLVDEAIAEFQIAMRAGDERLKVYEELGQCFMMKEQYNIAAKLLSRGAQLPASDDTELLGVYYQMARCYEELGRTDEAREAYERVLGLDLSFRDAEERMRNL